MWTFEYVHPPAFLNFMCAHTVSEHWGLNGLLHVATSSKVILRQVSS